MQAAQIMIINAQKLTLYQHRFPLAQVSYLKFTGINRKSLANMSILRVHLRTHKNASLPFGAFS
jgi:hypothetical protein